MSNIQDPIDEKMEQIRKCVETNGKHDMVDLGFHGGYLHYGCKNCPFKMKQTRE